MSGTETMIADFLEQRNIAVVGVSRTKSSVANGIFHRFKQAGYHVFPVNPNLDTFEGEPCYATLNSINERVDGVMIVTRPAVTESVVDECINLGIKRVWMHNMLGTSVRWGKGITQRTTSASETAVGKARAAGMAVIPGDCPLQHIPPVDGWHRCIHWIAGKVGNRD
ncbi:MAG TPA: CoA-binding protein [Blastocatellia bacterium]|nr:CoA-binding protein [Blastocatellia bacterium]